MSDFEYLQNVAVGQYLPLGSWLHQRDPRAKLLGFTLMVIALTLTVQLKGLLIGIASAFILMAFSKIPARYVLRGLLTPLPFLLILIIIQLFITPHVSSTNPIIKIWEIEVFSEGVLAGMRLFLRFCALVILLTISSATLSTLEMIHGLDLLFAPIKRLRIRSRGTAAMAVQITMRFIPFLAINAEKIAKAQASRGAEWGIKKGNFIKKIKQVLPLIIPLFSNSLKQSETLADAMLARGYSGDAQRTSMVEYRFAARDYIFLLVMTAASAMIILVR